MVQNTIILFSFTLIIAASGFLWYYIYSIVLLDAKSRGIKNPKFWSILAAGGQNGGGLLLYLFSRRKMSSLMNSAEFEQIQRLKRKVYCLLVFQLFLFLFFVATMFFL